MRNLNLKHFSCPRRQKGETIVQNNLAYTPSQMMELAEQGIPISSQAVSAENFYDGDTNPSFDLGIDRLRGVDVADCWQAEMSVRKKAKKGLKNDIRVYGNNVQVKGE